MLLEFSLAQFRGNVTRIFAFLIAILCRMRFKQSLLATVLLISLAAQSATSASAESKTKNTR